MHGRDALFPDFDQITDAENALTERLSQARRDYAKPPDHGLGWRG